MTVPATDRIAGPFNGNDATTAFPFTNFKVLDQGLFEVYHVSAAGAETKLTVSVDYTIVFNANQDAAPGGTITYPVSGDPLATGEQLYGKRVTSPLQEVDIITQGSWDPDVVETMVDRSRMREQELDEEMARTVKVSVSSGTDPDALVNSIFVAATAADASAVSASASEAAAAASFDSFDDRYLGEKTSDPTLDNDGDALLEGATYWNSTAKEMRVWNDAAWVASYTVAVAQTGNVNNPIVEIPLKSSLAAVRATGNFIYSRFSPATSIDRYGRVVHVGIDEPRFGPVGLLKEIQSTNLLQLSVQCTGAPWVESAWATVFVAQTATAPDETTAYHLRMTASFNDGFITQPTTQGVGDVVYLSGFFKKAELDKVELRLRGEYFNGGTTSDIVAEYDLTNGIVSSTTNTPEATGIEPLIDGWYRCWIKHTVTNIITAASAFEVKIYSTDTNLVGVYVWGMQWEDDYLTSYIPTPTTATVLRAAETLELEAGGNQPNLNGPMTWIADVVINYHVPSVEQVVLNYTGLNSNELTISNIGADAPHAHFGNGPVTYPTTLNVGQTYRIAGRRTAAKNVSLWIDGVERANGTVSDATLTAFPLGLHRLTIGNNLMGEISNIKIYDFALTNDELRLA